MKILCETEQTLEFLSLLLACTHEIIPIEWQYRHVRLAYIQMIGESVSIMFKDLKVLSPDEEVGESMTYFVPPSPFIIQWGNQPHCV